MRNLEIICVGNSHLASFKTAMQKALEKTEGVTIKFFPTTYMSAQWDNFKSNKYLTSPKFTPENPAKLPTDYNADINSILILVGLGLSGNSIFSHFGSLTYVDPDTVENGYNNSPLMPIVQGINIQPEPAESHILKRNAPRYSTGICNDIFTESINTFLKKMKSISSNSYFKAVYCVPAPNMPERTARWRFGEDYCNSKSQRIINDIYRSSLTRAALKSDLFDNIIQHDKRLENDFGFINNLYASSEKPNNNHTNPIYYGHIARKLVSKIDALKNKALAYA